MTTNHDISPAATWRAYNPDNDGAAVVLAATTLNQMLPGCKITSDLFAALYCDGVAPSNLYLVIHSISGGTTGTILVTSDTNQAAQVVRLSDSKAAVLYDDNSDGDLVIKTFTISGVTPTLDATSSTLGANGDLDDTWGIAALSETRAMVVLETGASEVSVVGITFGSGTITIDGSDTTISTNGTNNRCKISPLSSTTALIVYLDSSSKPAAVVATEGTPPTLGTPVTLVNEANAKIASKFVPPVSDDGLAALVSITSSTGSALIPLIISSTTVSVNSTIAAATSLSNTSLGIDADFANFLAKEGSFYTFSVLNKAVSTVGNKDFGITISFIDEDQILYGGGFYSETSGNSVGPQMIGMNEALAVMIYEDGNDDFAFKTLTR